MADRKPHKPLLFIEKRLVWLPNAPSAVMAGKPIGKYLQPWQRKVIKTALDEDGSPRQSIFLGWARKLGKSSLFSWLISYFLSEKEGWSGVTMASVFAQSAHIYDSVRAQIENNPRLKDSYKCTKERIVNEDKGNSLFRVYNKASSNLGMIGIRFCAQDQIESMQTRSNIDAVSTGTLMSDTAPFYMLASNAPEHLSHWSLQYLKEKKADPRYKFFEYAAPLKIRWDTEEAKKAANPFYKAVKLFPKKNRHLKALVSNINAEEAAALKSAEDAISYRRYILGQLISASAYKWIESSLLKVMPLREARRAERAILSFDLSLTRDFCAAALCFFKGEQIIIQPFLTLPNIEWRRRKQQYQMRRWAELGHIRIQDRETISREQFMQPIRAAIKGVKLAAHVWDRGLYSAEWSAEFPGKPVLMRGTPMNLTPGVRWLEAKARQGELFITEDNPAVKAQFDSAIASAKSKGYVNLDRASHHESIETALCAVQAAAWHLENKARRFALLSG